MKVSQVTKYSIAIIGFAITTVLLVTFVQRYTFHTRNQNLAYQKFDFFLQQNKTVFQKAADAKNSSAIVQAIQTNTNLLNAFYDGKQTGAGVFDIDDELGLKVKELLGALEAFQNEINNRNVQGTVDGADDWIGDASGNVLALTAQLRDSISLQMEDSKSFINALAWYTVALLSMGFTVLCIFMLRYMRTTDRYLQESKKSLLHESERVHSLSKFIESVSKGDYNIELNTNDKEDHLTEMLISMRESLKENAETERRRNWSTSGLAKIGEILRASSSSTAVLYDRIIQFVVKYTNSTQGGLFILNNDNEQDTFLELAACYAFERKKFIQKKIDIGQGLIGQCFLEGERIHLIEIPDEYINITSGLGKENPSAILLIPMKINDQVFGVIELATFAKYEDFEIAMVEEFAESIASTIATVKTNESTRILLEQTQQQAEEMRSQEEEMRQNMEELSATQEEMGRKEKEYILRIEELEAKLKGQEADTLK